MARPLSRPSVRLLAILCVVCGACGASAFVAPCHSGLAPLRQARALPARPTCWRSGRSWASPRALFEGSAADVLSKMFEANLEKALGPELTATLQPILSNEGAILLSLLSLVYLLAPPGVGGGLLDLALRAVDSVSEQMWGPEDIGPRVGRTLGSGNFGTVIESYLSDAGAAKLGVPPPRASGGGGGGGDGPRIVQKRCIDEEQADIEAYFNRRVRRIGSSAGFASFLGSSRRAGDVVGRLLVWKYEGSRTLEQYLEEFTFPDRNLEQLILRCEISADIEDEVRKSAVIREIMRRSLISIKALHGAGIVHRDIKPANIIVSEQSTGSPVLLVDMGAAVDMRNGFNFNPEEGILDPRYAPPELYVVPQTVPRAPPALLALLASPFLWAQHLPDRFDTYSAGMMLLQMSVPQLRRSDSLRTVTTKLSECDWDPEAWRVNFGGGFDFSLLDRNNGAGWDLCKQLLCPRPTRLTASKALSHRFFRNENLGVVKKVNEGGGQPPPHPQGAQQQRNGLLLGRGK